MMALVRAWLVAMMAAIAGQAGAVPVVDAYGRLPSVDLIALSPDGSKIALAVGDETRRQIQVRRVDDQSVTATLGTGKAKVRSLRWAGEHHLLITASQTAQLGGIVGPKREYYLVTDFNLATGRMSTLLSRGIDNVGKLNVVVGPPTPLILDGKPVAFVEGLTFPDTRGVVTLFRIDLDTGKTVVVLTGNNDTRDFLVDGAGTVVAAFDENATTGGVALWTRPTGGTLTWLKPAKGEDGPELIGFGRDAQTVLVSTEHDDQRVFHALVVGNSTLSPALAAMDDADPIFDPATRRLIGGVKESGSTVRYTFLAPADAALWAKVERAFPHAVVRLESWSDDRRRIVLRVEGKGFGAGYYLLDTTAMQAAHLADEYADITSDDLADQTALSYPAGDGLTIPAFLTLPPGRPATGLPLVVLVHGGPESHDDAGFDWWAQALASRGYAVLQPQFRGSTGQGIKFIVAGHGEWGRKMQTDLSDGVAYLAKKGTIDPKRVCIVGASYGGYAALAGVTVQQGIYACAVSLAGPADLRAMLDYEATRSGGEKTEVTRFWQTFMGAKSATDPALDAISPQRLAARADAPILLIHGQDDTVVLFAQSKAMAAALARAKRPAELVVLPGEDHWLSRSATRVAMLRATVNFLETNMPTAPASVPH